MPQFSRAPSSLGTVSRLDFWVVIVRVAIMPRRRCARARAGVALALMRARLGLMAAALALAAGAPSAAADGFSPGTPGLGDPFFPLAGNGVKSQLMLDGFVSADA